MIKIERKFDATRLNEVVNHEAVYPWVHGLVEGPLDFSPMFTPESLHINLMGEYGGIVFIHHMPGLYEAHTHILPPGRGPWAQAAAQECLDYMFTRTDAMELFTKVPKGNYAARALVRLMGATFQFRSPQGWVKDGKVVHADVFSMTLQEWMKNSDRLIELGKWFQNHLATEYERLGRKGLPFIDDDDHNRYVGAAMEMIRRGQAAKGTIIYNRWACMATRFPMTLISQNPVMVHIDGALIELHGSNFFISELAPNYLQ